MVFKKLLSDNTMKNQENKFDYNLFASDFEKEFNLKPKGNELLYLTYYNLRVNLVALKNNATFYNSVSTQLTLKK